MKALDEGFTRKCKEILKIMAENPHAEAIADVFIESGNRQKDYSAKWNAIYRIDAK